MAGKFSIEAVFRAVDRISAPISRMTNRVGKFTRQTKRGFVQANDRINRFTKSMKTMAVTVAASLLLVGGASAKVVTTGAEFEQTLVNAAAKFPSGIRKGTAAFKELEDAARKTGGTTEFTSTQAARGLEFLSLAGFSAKQSISALPGIVDLATAAQTELGLASDIATDSLGAFGLATKDPIQLAQNLSRVSDVLAKTTTTANTNITDLFEAVSKGGAAATEAGASIETFSALAGTLAESAVKGARAGTALKIAFLRLAAPTPEAATILRRLGVKPSSKGDLRDIINILGDLETSMAGFGTAQKLAILKGIFGSEAITAVSILLKKGSKSLKEYRTRLENAGGSTGKLAATMRDTLQGRLNSLSSAVEAVNISIFKLKDESITAIVDKLTEWTRAIDVAINTNDELISLILTDFISAITSGAKILGGLAITILFVKGVFVALGVVITTFTITVSILKGALFLLKGAFFLAKLSMAAFNIVMALNPIGALILIIGGLITAGFFLMENWDTVRQFFVDIWNVMVEKTQGAVDRIKGLISKISDPFIKFKNSVTRLGEKLSGLFGEEEKKIKVSVDAERKVSGKIPQVLKQEVPTLKKSAIEKVPGVLKKNIQEFKKLKVEETSKILKQDISSLKKSGIENISNIVNNLFNTVNNKEELEDKEIKVNNSQLQIISPELKLAQIQERKEIISKSQVELTVKDESNRMEVTNKKGDFLGFDFNLEPSGAF